MNAYLRCIDPKEYLSFGKQYNCTFLKMHPHTGRWMKVKGFAQATKCQCENNAGRITRYKRDRFCTNEDFLKVKEEWIKYVDLMWKLHKIEWYDCMDLRYLVHWFLVGEKAEDTVGLHEDKYNLPVAKVK